jgi:hypothetical protein
MIWFIRRNPLRPDSGAMDLRESNIYNTHIPEQQGLWT